MTATSLTIKELYDTLARQISRSERPNAPLFAFRLEDGTFSQPLRVTFNHVYGCFLLETTDVQDDEA